jgi:hypothetical protein
MGGAGMKLYRANLRKRLQERLVGQLCVVAKYYSSDKLKLVRVKSINGNCHAVVYKIGPWRDWRTRRYETVHPEYLMLYAEWLLVTATKGLSHEELGP